MARGRKQVRSGERKLTEVQEAFSYLGPPRVWAGGAFLFFCWGCFFIVGVSGDVVGLVGPPVVSCRPSDRGWATWALARTWLGWWGPLVFANVRKTWLGWWGPRHDLPTGRDWAGGALGTKSRDVVGLVGP